MHVKTTRRKRGDKTYEYLSLVESVRVDGKNTHRTLLRLGEVTALLASGELERVITALENHLERDQIAVYPFGFTNFNNYRLRSLLYAGRPNWDLLATITPQSRSLKSEAPLVSHYPKSGMDLQSI